jgi:histidine phosphotransferase ChpT
VAADDAGKGAAVAIDDPLRVAECVCARLCHDIAGAVGALMGSLELAREDAAMAEEAVALASVTGQALAARLRLIRAAWVGDGTPLDLAELARLAQGLAERRVRLDLSALAPATVFAPPVGRVILNLVLLGAEALPGGGTVWLEMAGPDLVIGIAGPRAQWPAGLAAALAGEAAIDGPRGLQAPLTVLLARAAGLHVSLLMPAATVGMVGTPHLLLALPAGG